MLHSPIVQGSDGVPDRNHSVNFCIVGVPKAMGPSFSIHCIAYGDILKLAQHLKNGERKSKYCIVINLNSINDPLRARALPSSKEGNPAPTIPCFFPNLSERSHSCVSFQLRIVQQKTPQLVLCSADLLFQQSGLIIRIAFLNRYQF